MNLFTEEEEEEVRRARSLTYELLRPTYSLNMATGMLRTTHPGMSKSAHTRALKAAREINAIVERHQ